jgi:N-acetylmuramoyl-L-alanine amidase
MSKVRRPAFLAALSVFAITAIGGSGAAPAFGAADILEAQSTSLLPSSVYETAGQEGETPVDLTIIPELPIDGDALNDDDVVAPTRNASSLATLVADNGRTQTASREDECLAVAVYFEAKSEALDGQLAVAEVILNRAKSGRFPASICGVVMQRGQFSFVHGNGFPPIARASRDWREAVAIAHIARNDLWNSSVQNALFFHARRVSPNWRMTRVAAVGNHIFYR